MTRSPSTTRSALTAAWNSEATLRLGTEEELGRLWREAGLQDVEVAPLTIQQEFASFDDYWGPFLLGTGPAGAYVATLDAPRREALRERLRARLLGNEPDRPFTLASRAWAVRGRVP